MKLQIRILLLALLIIPITFHSFGQIPEINEINPLEFIILSPSDTMINEFPLLEIKPHDEVTEYVMELSQDSYMKQAIRLYCHCQNFLVNSGRKDQVEPAYLLLSQNQGGFPKFGFFLKKDGEIVDKTETAYIELVKNNNNNEDHLGSMTQIYPHEMGHIIYRLLAADTDTIIPASVNIHYVSLTTDYTTAFNEGFAMHFENMARDFDPDSSRRQLILDDFTQKKESVKYKVSGYEKDFLWPLRMDFYRTTMLLWYQNFEDIKRFEWVKSGKIKYRNASRSFMDAEKSLFYLNSGIATEPQPRIPQQQFATEGVIASFFYHLMKGDLKYLPADTGIINQFLPIERKSDKTFGNELDPLEKQYMKIFYVLNKHVNFTLTEKSQLIDFVYGYCLEFPTEKEAIYKIFEESTGYSPTIDPGKELWITNHDHEHGILVMEQFGGITLPFYTFNLNAATKADLRTFQGITENEAEKIIDHIENNGPFFTYSRLESIDGISETTIKALIQNKFHPDHFKTLDGIYSGLSLSSLIYSNLYHLLIRLLISLAASILIIIFLNSILFNKAFMTKDVVFISLRYLLLFLIALICVVISDFPAMYFIGVVVFILLLNYFIYRKRENRKSILLSIAVILFVMMYSLV